MRCKNCGAHNEDYLEYCENCAAPLTPDEPESGRDAHSNDSGYKSYVASTGETPPAWGFVKAPQWPKPDFDANTVSEEDIPQNFFGKFNPRPADAERPAYARPAPLPADDEDFSNNVRVRGATPADGAAYGSGAPARTNASPARTSVPVRSAAVADDLAYGRPSAPARPAPAAPARGGKPYRESAPAEDADRPLPVPVKAHKPKKASDEFDYADSYSRKRAGTGGKRNLLFIAAAGVLVLLIAVFGFILVSTKYDGNFGKFISCTFKGDPVTRAPKVEASTTDAGDPAYLITVFAKNNYIVRFTAGELVREFPIIKGSRGLNVPETIWIPDEPLDSNTISITPDIVVISPTGVETQVEFEEPITITVPTISLTMTQPTVSDFTVDSATVAVSGVVDDNTASIFVGETQVSVDEAGNFSTNYTLPGEGTYVLEVKAQKNSCMSAVATYNITYGAATTPNTPAQGNVAFSVNENVKRYGTDVKMTVSGTMEQGATISVAGVELDGAITQDSAAGTFSFTVKTEKVGLYEAVVTATKGDAAKTSTVYLEHQPAKDTYMNGVYRIDYARIRDYPHHEQGYKIVGTITEIRQSAPYVIARIQTSEGDIMFCYFSGVSAVEMNDGKTYELYADPYGTDEATGLPYMHAWFILKKAN